ncbi:hypothetical protein O181_022932 [Austropuccinia psidii MF-1]|uniref:Uncharacterized protein n=1 Tax=Austropuccinia psidii MF-1 TaxID=1389203 RepID=A0A9Q3CGH5_9BASI|nr:hypothetical protein [Austropuccinia psidii MF-1]
MPSYGTFYFLKQNSFSQLERAKKVSTRTSFQASIDSESFDEQTNPPPQMSPQDVSFRFQHNKNNFPIPPPPKVGILHPAPSFSPLHPNPLLKEAALRIMIKSPKPNSILTGSQDGF